MVGRAPGPELDALLPLVDFPVVSQPLAEEMGSTSSVRSGLGALRRRADARWRIRPEDVDELAELQQRILLASAPLVKPGGSLVYSVCTLTKAESVDVVAATAGALAALGFRADLPADGDWESYGPDTLVVVPGAATDGMALARWRRA